MAEQTARTVYGVATGEYDEWQIQALFVERADAQRAVDRLGALDDEGRHEHAEVVELPLLPAGNDDLSRLWAAPGPTARHPFKLADPALTVPPPLDPREQRSRDLLTEAAERLHAWAERVANGSSDTSVRAPVRHAADRARYYAEQTYIPRYAVEAAAALLGVDPPPPTEREARLAAAAAVLMNSVTDPIVIRLANSDWQPPAAAGEAS